MMEWLYLAALLIGIMGIGIIDYRYKLAYWYDRHRTITTLGISVIVFSIWDIIGIACGIFFHGDSPFTLPFRLLPEFPVEELFFLVLLCYCTLVMYRGAQKW